MAGDQQGCPPLGTNLPPDRALSWRPSSTGRRTSGVAVSPAMLRQEEEEEEQQQKEGGVVVVVWSGGGSENRRVGNEGRKRRWRSGRKERRRRRNNSRPHKLRVPSTIWGSRQDMFTADEAVERPNGLELELELFRSRVQGLAGVHIEGGLEQNWDVNPEA